MIRSFVARQAVEEIWKALCSKAIVGPITKAPVITPTISATCCLHGVAPTMCPVFKSCITSPAIAALLATTAAMRSVAYISSVCDKPRNNDPTIQTRPTVNNNVAMVIPDTGELLEPTTPAMYPATAAKKNATIAKNNAPARDNTSEPVIIQ